MRINKFIASATGLSRRAADAAIAEGRVSLNGAPVQTGQAVSSGDTVTLDGHELHALAETTIMLNKPAGYVCSRNGQGSRTIYDLLPPELHVLKPVGRLDKDSSGLLLLTNDGQLAQELTHPKYQKQKVYEVVLDKPLEPLHRDIVQDPGVMLDDGRSQLQIDPIKNGYDTYWKVTMSEGRNRQIRRTFASLGYEVKKLHRVTFGNYSIGDIKPGKFEIVDMR